MSGFTVVHDEGLQREYGKWVLVRRSLGPRSFGMNMAELPPGESIPEHHELDRGQVEVFFVVSGSPTMVVDGDDHPLQPGSFVRLDPEPVRTVRNDGEETARVLIVSAPTGSGYEHMEWA